MKSKRISALLLSLVLILSVLSGCGGAGNNANNAVPADNSGNNSNNAEPVPAVSEEEMARLVDITKEGAEVIGSDRLNEGQYDISVLSGSEQFKIRSSKLVVVGNAMQLLIEVEGEAYSKMFAGKAADAASADTVIEGEATGNGTTTFRIPVKELNSVIECSAFADEYGKWFDRTLLAQTEGLDASAIKPVEAADTDKDKEEKEPSKDTDKKDEKKDDKKSDKKDDKKSSGGGTKPSGGSSTLKDGEYTVNVTFTGGTGKAKISSPAKLHVKNGKMTVTVVWTSKYYDYMKVNGKKYMNQNNGGNSTFTFPISALDKSFKVIGDTTAMSEPHEIEYTVKFSLKK